MAGGAADRGLGRFVLPVRQIQLLDHDGFLRSPVEAWPVGAGEQQPRLVDDLIGDGSSFALLAAGGAGKSTTFSAMSQRDAGAACIDVSVHRRDDIERELADVSGGDRTVYLDGLDQTAIQDPAVLRWLARRLLIPELAEIRWRLACRSAAWEASLADALRRSRGQFDEWKLLALDRETAQLIVANHFGDDREAAQFVEALARARLGTMTACVGQLLAAARYWRSEGRLPDGGIEAMQFEITALMREHNPDWSPGQSLESRITIAKRLGAMVVFSGEQVASIAPGATNTLSVDDLPDDPEPSNPAGRVEVGHYREVLGTALFDPGAASTVTFRHQRYAEFLAATYLVDRRATPNQVADLMGTRSTRALPAAMIPVVAWLTALNPNLVHDIVRDNAQVLAAAAAAVELPDGDARAVIVDGLLGATDLHEVEPDWSVVVSTLVHHDLGAQLLNRMAAGNLTPEQMWWVSRLAEAGKCTAVAAELAAIAHDTGWPEYVRRAAVAAVGVSGDDDAVTSLADLLHPGPDEDTDNEILAAVIDILYPRLLGTAAVLGALRPQPSDGLIGGWIMTLRDLPGRVPDGDLPALLAWLCSPDNEIDFYARTYMSGFFEAVLERAWRHCDVPDVAVALPAALVSLIEHKPGRLPMNPRYPWTTASREERRAFALTVLGAAAGGRNVRFVLHELRLLDRQDADWLLDQIDGSSPDVAGAAADCLPLLLYDPSSQLADRVLGLLDGHPASATVAFFRGSVETDDPRFAYERDHAARRRETAQRAEARQDARHAELLALLPLLDAAPLRWCEAVDLLTDPTDPARTDDVFGLDLTQRPGWERLTAGQRLRVLEAGLRYLDAHEPSAERWWALTRVNSGDTAPDWFGVQLMTTLVQHDEGLLAEISVPTWERWAAAVLATWTVALQRDDDVRPRLVARWPTEARSALIDTALAYLDVVNMKEVPFYPDGIYRELAAELRPALVERLHSDRYGPALTESLLDLVIAVCDKNDARELVRSLCKAAGPAALPALERLAELDAEAAVDRAADATPTRDDLVPALSRLDAAALDNERLATVATMLLDSFPNDAPTERHDFAVDPHRNMRQLTNVVLQQLTERGAVEELARILCGRADVDQQIVGRHLTQARRRRAELGYHSTTPRELINLLRRGDRRLVRDAADLLDVAVGQLDGLQHAIRHDGSFQEIWNDPWDPDPRPRTEDDISDWIRRRLRERVNDGVVTDREVQVDRPRGRGIGTRIDLKLTAYSAPSATLAQVLVEAKRVDNDELPTALRAQLVDRYLVPERLTHGLYLIYWIRPDQRPARWSRSTAADPSALKAKLTAQAAAVRDELGITIAVYVLDVSRPAPPQEQLADAVDLLW